MMRLEVQLTMSTVAIGWSAAVAGFFGMNLNHGIEPLEGAEPFYFWLVAGGTSFVGLFSFLALSRYLRSRGGGMGGGSDGTARELDAVTSLVTEMGPSVDYSFKKLVLLSSDPQHPFFSGGEGGGAGRGGPGFSTGNSTLVDPVFLSRGSGGGGCV